MDSSRDLAHLTQEVVTRIRAGDERAWTELYERYRDELLFSVRCRLGANLRNHLQSEDVLQSVMLEAIHEIPKFEDRGEGSLKRFLNVLISNKIRDRVDTFGAKKRQGTVGLTAALAANLTTRSQSLAYHDAEKFELLERALFSLPEEMRHVILLRKIDGLSGREAARVMNKTDDVCRKLFSRAMAKLALFAQGIGLDQ